MQAGRNVLIQHCVSASKASLLNFIYICAFSWLIQQLMMDEHEAAQQHFSTTHGCQCTHSVSFRWPNLCPSVYRTVFLNSVYQGSPVLLNQPNPYSKLHTHILTHHRGTDMALKVTGYKTTLIPRGLNDFQTPCSLFHFHFENSGHWVFPHITMIIHVLVFNMGGITAMRDSRLQGGGGKLSRLAWCLAYHLRSLLKCFSIWCNA